MRLAGRGPDPVSILGTGLLVKAAAWSVPAVTILGATPAFAASNNKLTVTAITATRSTSDNKLVTFALTVSNTNTAAPITITDIAFGTNAGWVSYSNENVGTYAAGSTTGTISFSATESDASKAYEQLVFTLVDNRGSTYNVTVTINKGSVDTTAIASFSQT